MIPLRNILSITILPLLMFSFSQCSSQKKLQEKAPVTIAEAYCQSWVAGIQGGGSGTNIFIPLESVSSNRITLDSVYFRGKAAKLETKPESPKLFIGRFLHDVNKLQDITMSGDPKEEYGNKMPKAPMKMPFELDESECVVSYQEDGETKYFKIENIVEKRSIPYPSAPPIKQ